MDFNLFEIAGKASRRVIEGVEDLGMALEEAVSSRLLGLIIKPGSIARDHESHILDEARQSLRNGDITEAAHQLERELYFSSIMPTCAGSLQRKSAHAGLDAIKRGAGADSVAYDMDRAIFGPAALLLKTPEN